MACSMEVLTKQLEEVNINKDIFLGNDLNLELKFLNAIIEYLEKKCEHCEVSFYTHKRMMSICCEIPTMNEEYARNVLRMVDWLMDEHFFQQNGLRELGWCSHYMFDRRTLNYHNHEFLKKTEVVEFYWFNKLPNRFRNQQTITEVQLCNCIYCNFFILEKNDFYKRATNEFWKIF